MISERDFTNNRNLRRVETATIRGRMITPGEWFVHSTTEADTVYTVLVEYSDGLLSAECSCQAGANKVPCKHWLWVLREIYFDAYLLHSLATQKRRAA
jgi:hypothetical protein